MIQRRKGGKKSSKSQKHLTLERVLGVIMLARLIGSWENDTRRLEAPEGTMSSFPRRSSDSVTTFPRTWTSSPLKGSSDLSECKAINLSVTITCLFWFGLASIVGNSKAWDGSEKGERMLSCESENIGCKITSLVSRVEDDIPVLSSPPDEEFIQSARLVEEHSVRYDVEVVCDKGCGKISG